jgi:hypothetical protein
MHEREPDENSNERMADRPERDAARLDETPAADRRYVAGKR